MKTIAIISNPAKKDARNVSMRLSSWFKKKGHRISIQKQGVKKLKDVDLVITLGGDGILLKVARQMCLQNIPVVGLNLGGMGFLTEHKDTALFATLDKFLKAKREHSSGYIQERLMLCAKFIHKGKKSRQLLALNDVVIKNGAAARVIDLQLHINGSSVASYVGDGLIIATPTGSTAYSLASNGPIILPGTGVFVVSAISPHALSLRPLVVSSEEEITISVKGKNRDVFLSIDGQEHFKLDIGDMITVKKAECSFKTIVNPKKSFYDVLRTRLKWGER